MEQSFTPYMLNPHGGTPYMHAIYSNFLVKKVSMFSPAAKAGLGVGDTLVTINDWNIEAMDNIQVGVN